MTKLILRSAAILVIGIALTPARADIKLPAIFSDGMVLQRDTSAPVWGTAQPGEKITLTLNGQTQTATADADGKWSADFQKLTAGGPFTLTITGDKSPAVTIANVLVGDVWLCSGQSNMTLPISNIKDFDPDVVTSANDPLLRCYTGPSAESATPATGSSVAQTDTAAPSFGQGGDVSSGSDKPASWQETNPKNVEGFSAMSYYFARELRKQLGIPIGFIHVSYGGSSVESWTSREGLAELGLGEQVDAQVNAWQNADALGEAFLTTDLAAWEAKNGRQDPGNKGFAAGWANTDFDATSWATLDTLGNWTSLSLPNGGIVWARKDINLPASAAGKDLTVNLGNLANQRDEYGNVIGTIYFNGKEIGPFGHKLQHLFSGADSVTATIPGALVTAGKNVMALRIVDQKETGPIFGNNKNQFLQPHIDPAVWAGPWQVKMESAFSPLPADAMASRPSPPAIVSTVCVATVLYNGMIAPVVGYGIKGFLWDQGTSNAFGTKGELFDSDRPGNYEKLFSKLIEDWRAKWKNKDLPFVFTQHPNFGQAPTDPPVSPLAAIREAQLFTWKSVPNTYMAMTLGLVTDSNIHYKNKKEAGHRLALAAFAGVYGQKVEASGPIYDSMAVEGNKIRIKFTHVDGGLVAKDGNLKTFAIAGEDKKFVWADAVIDGDTVVVSSSQVPNPVAVRYAWADNPVGFNLYNKDDLPASPFRTDNWYWHNK
jgi:sialate O-acetylesterase